MRTAGQFVLAAVAGLCALAYCMRSSFGLPVPDAVPICFTLAIGFLTIGAAAGRPKPPPVPKV